MKRILKGDGIAMLCERITVYGPTDVSDLELLSVVVGDASLALELLAKFGSLAHLCRAPRAEIERSRVVTAGQLARVRVAAEVGRRVALGVTEEPPTFMKDTNDVIRFFQPRLADAEVEIMFLVLLDTRKRVKRVLEIARGGINLLSVYPREVLAPAIRELAESMILAHVHPSGDPSPSSEDRRFTDRVRAIGEVVGIQLLDHVIVTRTGGQSV